ncbi:MAG: ribonuclease HII [Candidatus Micrarchaeota archaeon]
MATLIGVDEAGRGCVIGPLVICAFKINEKHEIELKKMGVKDSKLLAPTTRNKLYKELIKSKHCLRIIPATELTELMNKKISLNEIEAIKIAECLQELDDNETTAFIDSPDANPKKFAERIKRLAPNLKIKIIAENKADVNHLVASAASIIAKETREMEVTRIKKLVGDFGSGYTSDGKTIVFLKKHYGKNKALNEFIREKWSTIKNLKTTQVKLGNYFK